MKTYITRINGWSLRDKSHYMQHMVAEIAHQLGGREMGIYRYYAEEESWESLSSRLDGIIAGINSDDLVIYQFPTGNGMRFENTLVDRLKAYGGRLAIFIHELEALSHEEKRSQLGETVSLLNKAEVLIVPTYAMRQWLLENGIQKSMKFVVQEMWDYTVSEPLSSAPTLKTEITFADGEGFAGMNEWNYSVPLKLYNVSANQGNIQNLGERDPYQLFLELNRGGGFGLVWYRDEYARQYMELSNSFSLARYLAAGFPVIIPVESSHRMLVEANHLGIAVNSLEEAAAAVERITEGEYRDYRQAVEQFAPALRDGYFTKKCLMEAMQAFYRKDAGRLSLPERVYEAGENAFKSVVLKESYGGNLAFSWDFKGEADGFLIYDTEGALLGNTRDFHQHYFIFKGLEKEKGIIIKAYVDTLKGKLIIAKSTPTYLQEGSYGTPKVSMVIPAYNAENYIARCIDTVLAQSQPDVEILVVDDGSSDHTPEIIDWYAERYGNVMAIHQKNGGVAAARNTGIMRANGEYIGFVDSDDMICPSMVERLYQSAKRNNCDIAITSTCQITNHGYEFFIFMQYSMKEDVAVDWDDFFEIYLINAFQAPAVWNKLYRKALLKGHRMPQIPYEDEAWTPCILSYAEKVCYLNDGLYEYDRVIRKETLYDELERASIDQFENHKRAILFYLENSNPKRLDKLKLLAERELSLFTVKYGNNEYDKLKKQIPEMKLISI